MIGKKLIIVGADYSDVSIGKLKVALTSSTLKSSETATLTLSAPSITSPTFSATTESSLITLNGSNPYTITGGSEDGTAVIKCTLTYVEGSETKTENKNISIKIANSEPVPEIVWHTSHYNDNDTFNQTVKYGYAGFAYKDTTKGTETVGAKFNRLRLVLSSSGILTVGIVDSTLKNIVSSEILTITGNDGDVIIASTVNTYTLAEGQHFFVGLSTDTAVFKYNRVSSLDKSASFYTRVGTTSGGSSSISSDYDNLSVDFGYQA